MIAGVYRIRNRVTGRSYVGSSISVHHRIKWHIARMKCGMHENKRLRSDWKEHGPSAFSFSLLEETASDNEVLIEAEQRWMNLVAAQSQGMYNVHLNSRLGRIGTMGRPSWRALRDLDAELEAKTDD